MSLLDTILTGDAWQLAKTLPDQSVNCIITSPPYFGLRDYGTAQWDGGDPGCDHASAKKNPVNVGGFQGERIRSNAYGWHERI